MSVKVKYSTIDKHYKVGKLFPLPPELNECRDLHDASRWKETQLTNKLKTINPRKK